MNANLALGVRKSVSEASLALAFTKSGSLDLADFLTFAIFDLLAFDKFDHLAWAYFLDLADTFEFSTFVSSTPPPPPSLLAFRGFLVLADVVYSIDVSWAAILLNPLINRW